MRILGIDPGSQNVGFGVIDVQSEKLRYVEHGVIQLKAKEEFLSRMKTLGARMDELLSRFQPQILVIEKAFVGKNVDSAFKLGHARGICIYLAMNRGALVAEYAPREIKKGITGSGAAEKDQVATCVQALLGLRTLDSVSFDATDALAMAVHHAHVLEQQIRLDPRRFLDR
ncbi:MAG: crossover junction endodeoxyribonuclease RuvC [Bdellovibrionales bacterium]